MNYLFKNILFSSKISAVYKTNYTMHYDHLEFHPHYELYFCPKAPKQILTLNGRQYRIEKPCIIITEPYTVHLMESEESIETFERFVIYFSKDVFSCAPWLFNKDIFSHTVFFESDSFSLIEDAVKNIFNNNLSENHRCACLIEILSYLSDKTPIFLQEKDNVVSPILQYIHTNLSKNLKGEEIAKYFHMSRPTLDRLFQKYVGQPLHKTIIDFRINNAISLLKYSNMSISTIAHQCGFENEIYFFAFFKKHTNISPLKYRNSSLPEK